MKIKYCGAKGAGWGWGVFGESIARELAKLGALTENAADADVALIPLADHDLNAGSPVRARVNLAVCFFEFELGPNAAANAAKYDLIFAGSTWCLDRLAERGIHNTALLIQGVDEKQFSPQPKRQPDGQFRIFSGGKFEFRKGQDLVIAAFREFAKAHPEVQVVGISYQDDVGEARAFAKQAGATWPSIVDDGPIGSGFKVPGLPATFIIDPAGTVTYRLLGEVTEQQLVELVKPRATS